MVTLNRVVILNMAFVFAHQADAVYWHEWKMFGLPGGIQLFNALNVIIFVLVMALLVPVVQRQMSGFRCSLAIALICASVLPIHAGFALAGFEEFNLPFSVFLVAATFVTSIVQLALTLRARGEFGGA